jgi:hypothetical protein
MAVKHPEYAFLLPDRWTRQQIAWAQGATETLRPEQIDRMWHLLSSWGVGQGCYAVHFFSAMRRAIRKIHNDYP